MVHEQLLIGGGVFGATLAAHLARRGGSTVLLEAGPALLGRASTINQARIHVGYHYPRSFLTGVRSRLNAPRFIEEYRECVVDDFAHYYAIGRAFSNVTASQFRRFCERIGAPITPAPSKAVKLFNPDLVEAVFQVPEATFDAVRLAQRLGRDLAAAGVDVRLGTAGRSVARRADGVLEVTLDNGEILAARQVFNCTYSRLNEVHAASGLPIVPLKHELTEMALVESPAVLQHAGVTVMCGPFFSMLPYPPRGLHTLSHVRYTPHRSWQDAEATYRPGNWPMAARPASHFPHMVRDAARFLPLMRDCRQVDSLWEIKTVLPRSEIDDSRPILFSRDHGLPGFHCVIGSKVDNAYDMLEHADRLSGAAVR